VFFDVKERWKPLCKMLGKPIRKEVPFLKINDGKAIEKFVKQVVVRELVRWAVLFMSIGAALVLFVCPRGVVPRCGFVRGRVPANAVCTFGRKKAF